MQTGDGAPIELCVSLADDATLRDLNARYRGQDKPTNVLAFAYEEADTPEAVTPEAVPGLPRSMGDVILSLETLEREAAAQGKSLRDHFCHLVVHGCLHLVGFDHEERAEAEEMEALEVQVLAGLGIADPYAEERGAPLSLGGVA